MYPWQSLEQEFQDVFEAKEAKEAKDEQDRDQALDEHVRSIRLCIERAEKLLLDDSERQEAHQHAVLAAVDTLRTETDTVRQERDVARAEADELRDKVRSMTTQLEDQNTTLREVGQEMNETKIRLQQANEELEDSERVKQDMITKFRTTQTTLDETTKERDTLKEAMETLRLDAQSKLELMAVEIEEKSNELLKVQATRIERDLRYEAAAQSIFSARKGLIGNARQRHTLMSMVACLKNRRMIVDYLRAQNDKKLHAVALELEEALNIDGPQLNKLLASVQI